MPKEHSRIFAFSCVYMQCFFGAFSLAWSCHSRLFLACLFSFLACLSPRSDFHILAAFLPLWVMCCTLISTASPAILAAGSPSNDAAFLMNLQARRPLLSRFPCFGVNNTADKHTTIYAHLCVSERASAIIKQGGRRSAPPSPFLSSGKCQN